MGSFEGVWRCVLFVWKGRGVGSGPLSDGRGMRSVWRVLSCLRRSGWGLGVWERCIVASGLWSYSVALETMNRVLCDVERI